MANFKQIIAMCLDGASYAQITHALGCSRREVSRAKKVIADEALTPGRFRQLPPGWFERVSDSLYAGAWFTSSPRIGRGKPRLVG